MEKLEFKFKDVEEEYARLYKTGNNYTLYIRKIVLQEFLGRPRSVFPTVVECDSRRGLAFYFQPPEHYSLKPYKVYYLERNGSEFAYLPVPDLLKSLVLNSRSNSLVKYTIGYDTNDKLVVFIERAVK